MDTASLLIAQLIASTSPPGRDGLCLVGATGLSGRRRRGRLVVVSTARGEEPGQTHRAGSARPSP